jgi:hypothetical protein
MINNVISVIADRINENLNNRFSSGNLVLPTSLNNLEDETNSDAQNRLLLTVTNIEQERLSQRRISGRPINLYLYFLLSANFQQSNYEEGLNLLSGAISFFQYTSVFNHQNTPDLHDNIEKLVFEMVNLNVQELSQLWGIHGGKYLPSVLYKIRMVTISEDIVQQSYNIGGFGSSIS